ncbi:unnamed protein product [Meganyctiphanes norvegica]|uniref:Focadhesin n=1 Tax=Meganyctiphanes norvegica TaxID=48144 RepID=A0AAV2QWH6_MEGNR
MEDFEQKISSGNVFLQSQAITKLHSKVTEFAKVNKDVYETDEVKRLWKVLNQGDVTEATLAVEILVAMVKGGLIPLPATLQNFLADINNAKSPMCIVSGITEMLLILARSECKEDEGELQCPFTGPPSGPIHPYVTLITKRPDLSSAILEEVTSLMRHMDNRIRSASLRLIKPLIVHAFCLTESISPITRPLLNLLTTSHHLQPDLGVIQLLAHILTLVPDGNKDHTLRKILLLNALSELSVSTNCSHLQSAVLPCIVSALPLALKSGLGTRTLEYHIETIASQMGRGCDVTLSALAEVLPQISGQLQVHLLKLATISLNLHVSSIVDHVCLFPSLSFPLQVLTFPSISIYKPSKGIAPNTLMSPGLLRSMTLHKSVNSLKSGNSYWEILCCTFPSLATLVPSLEFCDRLIKNPQLASDWLTKLAASTTQISTFNYSVVVAVFLYQGSTTQSIQEATKVLEREVMKNKPLSLEVFPIMLYRLGREQDPSTRLTILYTLPSLAVNKLCIALVLKTLLALWSSGSLRPLVLRLMYELWTVEPRTYAYLSQLIHDKTINTTELQISRAFVRGVIIGYTCRLKVGSHSNFPLARSSFECQPWITSLNTARVGIQYMAGSSVIDLRTTWRVIAPKLVRDKRREVTVKLCKLLSLVPELQVSSPEYESFRKDSLSILWSWATSSHVPINVTEAAYQALEKFHYEHYRLKMFPGYMREGHKLPARLATNPFEAARKPEDVLDYVPGLAWIKLISKCPIVHFQYVSNFVKSLVATEVKGLPKGIYMTAIQEAKKKGVKGSGGQPEPPSYSFLGESSVLKALITFLLDFNKLVDESDIVEKKVRLVKGAEIALSALGQPLHRPYPALDWAFLGEVYSAAQDSVGAEEASSLRHNIFRIATQQCNKSPSAAYLVTRWLSPAPSNGLTKEDEIVLFGLLDHLGRGLPPTTLQPFLAYILNLHISDDEHLIALLNSIKPNLTADFIHDTNRNILSNAIEGLNEQMDPMNTNVYAAYKECVADLPLKHIERLTSPSLWWEVTDDRLYRAAVLRCHVAENDPEETALPWLNDIVDSAASLPGNKSKVLQFVVKVNDHKQLTQESTNWLLQLMG